MKRYLLMLLLIAGLSFSIDVAGCQKISSSGTYHLTRDLVGANITTSPFYGVACIVISSPNVTLDCAGYNITDNGTTGAIGIFANDSFSNITVMDCPAISSYDYAIIAFSNNSNISNVTAVGDPIRVEGYNNSIANNILSGNNASIQIYGSYARIVNNTINNEVSVGSSFVIDYGSNILLENNTVSNSASGFSIGSSGQLNTSKITNNRAINLSGASLVSFSINCANCSIASNRIENSSGGLTLYGGDHSDISGNKLENVDYGFDIYGANITVSDNNCAMNPGRANFVNAFSVSTSSSDFANVIGNRAMNAGMVLNVGSNSSISGNVVVNEIVYNGFIIATNNALIQNNSLWNGAFSGSGSNNTLSGNNVSNGSLTFSGDNVSVLDNYVVNGTGTSFSLTNSRIQNNRFYGDLSYTNDALSLSNSENLTLEDNIACEGKYGINIDSSNFNVSLRNNTMCDNLEYGLHINDLNNNLTTANGDHIYNNSGGIWIGGTSGYSDGIVNLSYVILDTPHGSFQNFTNLSVYDILGIYERYSVSSIPAPAYFALPGGFKPFRNDYLNITAYQSPSIEKISWNWYDGELGGSDETQFSLWKFNRSAWVPFGGSLDTGNNMISLTDYAPADYAIYTMLEPGSIPVPENAIITYPGRYFMDSNSEGAPSIGYPYNESCINILSSDVSLDCANFHLIGDGVPGTAGIKVENKDNLTIKNCFIENFSGPAIQFFNVNNTALINDTAYNNSGDISGPFLCGDYSDDDGGGFSISNSRHILIENSTSRKNFPNGIFTCDVSDISFKNNSVYDNRYTPISRQGGGFFLDFYSDGIVMENNDVHNNTGAGITLIGNIDANFSHNQVFNNSEDGFWFDSSDNVVMVNNTARNNNFSGIDFRDGGGKNVTMANNTAYGNRNAGLKLSSNRSTLSGDRFYNNSPDFYYYTNIAAELNMSNVIFDRNEGDLIHETILSLNDTLAAFSGYSIDHAIPPGSMPANRTPFDDKFINMTWYGANPINSITWHWLDPELGSANESNFELWKYNSSWTKLNGTLNASANTISYSNLNPQGVFGILEANPLPLSARIEVVKTSFTTNPPSPGGIVQFNITVRNIGADTLDPVTVNDTLPSGLTFISSDPVNSSGNGQNIGWSVGSLAPSASQSIIVNTSVGGGIVSDSIRLASLTNRVNATGTPPSGPDIHTNASADVTIYHANVSIIKVNATSALPSPGGIVQFNITLTNRGNVSLNSTILDILPSGLTFASASPSGSISGQNVSWAINDLASGSSQVLRLNATVDQGVVNAGSPIAFLANPVNVSSKPPNGNNVTANSIANVPVSYANVSILKLDQTASTPSPGGITQFNITLTNTGNVSILPRIFDTLPTGLSYLNAYPSETSLVGRNVTWDDPTPLAGGASRTYLLNASVDFGVVNGTTNSINLTNNVNVTGVPPNGGNVTASSWANVTVFYANISILKLDQTILPPSPGGIIQFNLTISNSGNITLNPIIVSDRLPIGLTFRSSYPANNSSSGNIINWSIGPLSPGANTTIHLNATVNPGVVSAGTHIVNLTNIVNATGNPPNGERMTSASSANATIFYANLSVAKTNINTAPISPGGTVEWQINITNTGNVVIDPVALNDTLPTGLTFLSASPANTSGSGHTVFWSNVGPLTPGASTLIFLNTTAVTSGSFINNASARGVPPNGNNVSAFDTESVGVSVPAVSVRKMIEGPSSVPIGQNLRFKLNITNTGATGLNITVVDVLPAGTVYAGASSPETSNVSGTVVWDNLITLAPLSSTLLSYNATILVPGSYSNDVNVTGNPPSGNNVSDSDSVSFTGLPPNISITKTVSSTVLVGQNATFYIVVKNSGFTKLNISLIDTLPAGLIYAGASVPETSNISGTVTWTNILVDFAPGATYMLAINATVDGLGRYTNIVNATGIPPLGGAVYDNDSATLSGVRTIIAPPTHEALPALEISVQDGCNSSNITVKSGGENATGVLISVQRSDGMSVFSGETDGFVGLNPLTYPGASHRIHASKSGYMPASLETILGDSCGGAIGFPCRGNSDCQPGLYCDLPAFGTLGTCKQAISIPQLVITKNCIGNGSIITVKNDADELVPGTFVDIWENAFSNARHLSGTTNSSGQIAFTDNIFSVRITASKSGYLDGALDADFRWCAVSASTLECTQDSDCAGNPMGHVCVNHFCEGCDFSYNRGCASPTPVCERFDGYSCPGSGVPCSPNPSGASSNPFIILGCGTDIGNCLPVLVYQCVECRGNGACGSDKSICANNKCVECTNNENCVARDPSKPFCGGDYVCYGCRYRLDCTNPQAPNYDRNKPICGPDHVCVECSPDIYAPDDINAKCNDLDPSKPVCAPDYSCVECTSDKTCSGSTPACNSNINKCVQCTSDDTCSGLTPHCDTDFNKCVQCTQNDQCPESSLGCDSRSNTCKCSSDLYCQNRTLLGLGYNPLTPACSPDGSCVECTSDRQCSGSTPACDLNTDKCVECTTDSQCTDPSKPSCRNNQCQPSQCDNQVLEPGEECEITPEDLNGRNCTNLGYRRGSLGCYDNCTFDTSECIKCTSDPQCAAMNPLKPICLDGQCVGCKTDENCHDQYLKKCDLATHSCVECFDPTDCPTSKRMCIDHSCRQCKEDTDCTLYSTAPAPSFCSDFYCHECIDDSFTSATPDKGCDANAPVCNGGTCTKCAGPADCQSPTEPYCQYPASSSSKCVECLSDQDCPTEKPACSSEGICYRSAEIDDPCTLDTDCGPAGSGWACEGPTGSKKCAKYEITLSPLSSFRILLKATRNGIAFFPATFSLTGDNCEPTPSSGTTDPDGTKEINLGLCQDDQHIKAILRLPNGNSIQSNTINYAGTNCTVPTFMILAIIALYLFVANRGNKKIKPKGKAVKHKKQ